MKLLLPASLLLPVKLLSIILISAFPALELWHRLVSPLPWWLLGFIRFAVMAHGIEALVAAYFAPRKNRQPLNYAIYTFLVGTVALAELFTPEVQGAEAPAAEP
jgi:hypothetical protein